MAVIIPIQTIKSTTAEQHLLEILLFIEQQEQMAIKNPTVANNISGSISLSSNTVSLVATLPISKALNAAGESVTAAKNYLSGVEFNSTPNATFKSTNPIAYALEVATYLQIKESDSTKNPNGINNISISTDDDRGVCTISASLPCEIAITAAGAIEYKVKEYLV